MNEQQEVAMGGTMRLERISATLERSLHRIYGQTDLWAHRHRYELNPSYLEALAGHKSLAVPAESTAGGTLGTLTFACNSPRFKSVDATASFVERFMLCYKKWLGGSCLAQAAPVDDIVCVMHPFWGWFRINRWGWSGGLNRPTDWQAQSRHPWASQIVRWFYYVEWNLKLKISSFKGNVVASPDVTIHSETLTVRLDDQPNQRSLGRGRVVITAGDRKAYSEKPN